MCSMFRGIFAGLAVIMLSACMGGGGGGTAPEAVKAIPSHTVADLPKGQGAETGLINAGTLRGMPGALAQLQADIDNDVLRAPEALPQSEACLHGYVSMDGARDTDRVVGNLSVRADFGAGTVISKATDFRDYDFSDPANPKRLPAPDPNARLLAVGTVQGGTLDGSGTISRTEIASTLNGQINVNGNATDVKAMMSGGVYDNAGLLIAGDVTGTIGAERIGNGAFHAME